MLMEDSERRAAINLATCPSLEPSMLRRILQKGVRVQRLWDAPLGELADVVRNPARVADGIRNWRERVGTTDVEQRLAAKGITCCLAGDEEYPPALLDLPDPPVVLFAMGQVRAAAPTVAIVGTRRASAYGLEATGWIAGAVADAGCTVVSGLALGIDAAAHQAALGMSAATIAVMACGVDVCYPPSHRSLYLNIQRQGAIYSEYAPGSTVAKHRFPERNRLIAALATALVVVQAGERSGALRTVESALELGRDVYAVPGPITSVHYRGSHRLLQDGARILVDPIDLLRDLQVATTPRSFAVPERYANLYLAMEEPMSAGALADTLGLPVSHIYAGLLELELSGFIERVPGGTYRRNSKVCN